MLVQTHLSHSQTLIAQDESTFHNPIITIARYVDLINNDVMRNCTTN